jgi:hypothetical protein
MTDRFYNQLDQLRGGFYYYPGSDKVETFPLYNLEIESEESNNVIPAMNLNSRVSAISPDRSKFATVMMHYPGLEIFNVGSKTADRYLLDPKPPSVTFDLVSYNLNEILAYYTFLDATNNYIYLQYSGVNDRSSVHETRIQVMDWNGNPQAQYVIPAKYSLAMFTVDEKNKRFYGVSHINDAIYQFDYN